MFPDISLTWTTFFTNFSELSWILCNLWVLYQTSKSSTLWNSNYIQLPVKKVMLCWIKLGILVHNRIWGAGARLKKILGSNVLLTLLEKKNQKSSLRTPLFLKLIQNTASIFLILASSDEKIFTFLFNKVKRTSDF